MSRFHNMHSRREFVKTARTAGAGALLPAVNAAGQDRRQGRIDVHHHCRAVIVNHSGAAIPTLAGRIKDRMPAGTETTVPKGAMYELQKLYYEVAHATYPYPMAALRSVAPSTHVLFGTDYPLEPIESTHNEMAKLRLPSDLQRAVDRTNAERLIPRLARAL